MHPAISILQERQNDQLCDGIETLPVNKQTIIVPWLSPPTSIASQSSLPGVLPPNRPYQRWIHMGALAPS